jgi:iron(III) transport system substrate-binding protein
MLKSLKVSLMILSLFILAALVACGNNGGDSSANEAEENTNQQTEEADPNTDQSLVVYTNSNSDGRGEWLVEEAKKAGFQIEIVGAGGGDVTNRLISEKANPVADVVFGLNHMFFEQLQAEDVLIPYKPSWADEIEAGINDPENYYNGLVKQALILAYNPEYIESADVEGGYVELANTEKFHELYQARDGLGSATAKVIVASILSQYKDENGELGVSEEGWKAIDKFFENGVQIPEGEDYFSMFASGAAPIGTMISGELGAKTEQYGVEPEFIHPEAGTPLVVESVAIVNGTSKEEKAKEFIDWFGSAEVQGSFAAEFGAMPANQGALDQVTDFQTTIFENVKSQDIDWGFVTENIDSWVEKLELEIF